MEKKRRVNKRNGIIIGLEETFDVLRAIRHSMLTEKQIAIEYMRKGMSPLGRLHYKQWKELNEVYRTVKDASHCTYGSWRKAGWFER